MNVKQYRADGLVFVGKAVDFLIEHVYPRLVNFPKIENRFLCPRLKDTIIEMVALAEMATVRKGSARLSLYHDIDAKLKFLLVLIEIAFRRKYVSERTTALWQEKVSELGRILGGLIKAEIPQQSWPAKR